MPQRQPTETHKIKLTGTNSRMHKNNRNSNSVQKLNGIIVATATASRIVQLYNVPVTHATCRDILVDAATVGIAELHKSQQQS